MINGREMRSELDRIPDTMRVMVSNGSCPVCGFEFSPKEIVGIRYLDNFSNVAYIEISPDESGEPSCEGCC